MIASNVLTTDELAAYKLFKDHFSGLTLQEALNVVSALNSYLVQLGVHADANPDKFILR